MREYDTVSCPRRFLRDPLLLDGILSEATGSSNGGGEPSSIEGHLALYHQWLSLLSR